MELTLSPTGQDFPKMLTTPQKKALAKKISVISPLCGHPPKLIFRRRLLSPRELSCCQLGPLMAECLLETLAASHQVALWKKLKSIFAISPPASAGPISRAMRRVSCGELLIKISQLKFARSCANLATAICSEPRPCQENASFESKQLTPWFFERFLSNSALKKRSPCGLRNVERRPTANGMMTRHGPGSKPSVERVGLPQNSSPASMRLVFQKGSAETWVGQDFSSPCTF